MMTHEFIVTKKEEIPDYTNANYVIDVCDMQKTRDVIIVNNDIIVNNKLFQKGFKSFAVSFKNPSEGLDYHGMTIIPDTSISGFQANVIKAKESTRRWKIKRQLDELIALCEKATKENLYIIHFGL